MPRNRRGKAGGSKGTGPVQTNLVEWKPSPYDSLPDTWVGLIRSRPHWELRTSGNWWRLILIRERDKDGVPTVVETLTHAVVEDHQFTRARRRSIGDLSDGDFLLKCAEAGLDRYMKREASNNG